MSNKKKTTTSSRTGKAAAGSSASIRTRKSGKGAEVPPTKQTASREITDPHAAAELLRKSRENLRRAERIARIGNWEWDITTNELIWSDEVYRIYGMDPARDKPSYEIVVKTVTPEDRERFSQAVEDAVKENVPFDGEYRIIGLDGVERFTHTVGEVVRDRRGKPVSMFGIVQDITDRKQAEMALRESENRLNTILDNVGAAIFIKDAQYRYTYANRRVCEIFGRAPDEILGNGDAAFFSPESVREVLASDRPVIERGETVVRQEENLISAEGQPHTYWTIKLPLRDRAGKITGLYGISTDITEQKQASEKLKHMHQLMQYVISHAQSAIAVHDREMRYIYVSEQYLRQYRVTKSDVIGKHHYDVFPDLPQKWRDVHQRVLAGAVEGKDEDPYLRADGTLEWTRWECRPWYESDGSIGGLIVYTEVITDRVRREEALRESNKRLSFILSRGPAVIYTAKASGDFGATYVSENVYEQLGYQARQFTEEPNFWRDRIHPDDAARVASDLHRLFEQGRHIHEYRFRRADGNYAWMRDELQLLRAGDGAPQEIIGSWVDITDRKRREEALRASEERFRTLFDESPVPLWEEDLTDLARHLDELRASGISDLESYFRERPEEVIACIGKIRVISVNRATLSLYEAPDQETLLQGLARVFTLESLDAFRSIVVALFLGSEHYECETVNQTLAGRKLQVLLQWSFLPRPGDAASRALISIVDITERKHVEELLQQSEETYRMLFEASTDGIFILGMDGRFVDANRTAYERLGYSREELLGMTIRELDDPQFAPHVPERLRQIREKGVAVFESGHLRKDGTTMPVEVNSRLHVYKGETVFFSVIRDITERKRAQEENDRLARAVSIITEGIAVTDEQDRFLFVNDAHAKLYGCMPQELLGKTWRDITPPELVPAVETEFARTVKNRAIGVWSGEVPGLLKDGRLIATEVTATARWGETGAYLGHICVVRDITERKAAEERLRESEQKYRAIVESTSEWIWSCDTRGIHTYSNGAVQGILGYAPEEIVGRSAMDLLHPDDVDAAGRAIERAAAARSGWSGLQLRWRHRDGTYRTLEGSSAPVLDKAGALQGWLGVDRDITQRLRAEEALRESNQYLQAIMDGVDEGFILVDREYRIMTANKAYCAQLGLSREEVIGRHCYEVSHHHERPCFQEGEECVVRQVLLTGEPARATHEHFDGTGHVLFVETKGFPIRDASGTVTSVIETINNITERHLLEEERLKTQKLESIGTLAGGIAHDFNNLLQGVFGYISMAKKTYEQRERSLAMLEQAEKALQQSVSLTTQLLTFSKGGMPVRRRTDLTQVIENAAKFALSGSRSGLTLDIFPDLWAVDADSGQIGQVIQNIVLNADQAMPKGGKVAIIARNMLGNDAALPVTLAGRDHVLITISDTGIGIPEEHLGRIFDPYFTTKEKGNGLGLATAYSIIRNHDGIITVRSRVGKGTTFLLYLPAAAGRAEEPERNAVPAASGRHGRILVMDDEEMVRMVAGELIRELGHEPVFAEDGETAVRLYEEAWKADRPFDVVILDLTIRGGMGGVEAVKRLQAIDPAVRTVVSSGYSDDAVVADYRAHGFAAFLKKPYAIEALRDVLNDVMQ